MAGVVCIKDISGGNNFLIKRGSNGVNEANYSEQLEDHP